MHLIYGKKKFVRKINGKCFYEITFALKMIDLSSNINHLNKKKLLTLLTTRISPFNVCREFVLAKSSKKRFWCNAKYCCMSYPKSKLSVIQIKYVLALMSDNKDWVWFFMFYYDQWYRFIRYMIYMYRFIAAPNFFDNLSIIQLIKQTPYGCQK